MSRRELRFPDGFLWGAATAAHQNEGMNVHNDFWAWEQAGQHTADGSVSGMACDWWNRAEEDFDRAASLGLNALRLSIEWSRIEPEPGQWNATALGRYRDMLRALRDRGLAPMVTLHHFTARAGLGARRLAFSRRGAGLRPLLRLHGVDAGGSVQHLVHAQRARHLRGVCLHSRTVAG